MPALLRTLLLGLVVSGLAACSTLQPVDTPTIELPPGSAIRDPQIEQAILNALNTYRWHVGQIQPGRVQADILVRERHQAAITIDYNPRDIFIRYRSSQGLEYKNGKIHRTYNRWVKYLKLEIEHQLNLPPTP